MDTSKPRNKSIMNRERDRDRETEEEEEADAAPTAKKKTEQDVVNQCLKFEQL